MKTIFLGEAASDSGSLGFSEAWPLWHNCKLPRLTTEPARLGGGETKSGGKMLGNHSPSSPHRVDVHALGNIHDQFHVGIVVVVCASGDLDVVVGHSDVVCVGRQIFGGSHDGEVDGSLVAERLVGPFSD